jgi:hypothetical protein
LATLFKDALNRSFVFSTHVVRDLVRYLRSVRPRKWLDRQLMPILSSVLGPNGGLWDSASGLYFKASWIKLFPSSRIANKLRNPDQSTDPGSSERDPSSIEEGS